MCGGQAGYVRQERNELQRGGDNMAEQDPREYRGGVHEPADAKGGDASGADNEGIVPREMLDDPGAPPPEREQGQALSDAALGEVTDRSDPSEDNIEREGGDAADATSDSGTGANAAEVREQMEEGQPVPWPQAANVAREDHDTERDAQT
jgi:hypothetical protein